MVEEERGGPAGYIQVKRRVEEVVDALSELSMFNLIVFADAATALHPQLVIANAENRNQAKLFVRPFNTEGNWGLTQGNVKESDKGLDAGGGTTRLDLALTAAFEQNADTILVISDGIPKVEKVWTDEQRAQFRETQRRWSEENAERVATWDAANVAYAASGEVVSEKIWVPPVEPQKGGLKEGRAPQVAREGHWQTVERRIGGHIQHPGPRPEPPKAEPGWWTLADFVQHLSMLYDGVYVPKGQPQPTIHCIGYQIDKDGHAFLQALAKQYHGQYRRVQRLK
jgi:hypothetical protein